MDVTTQKRCLTLVAAGFLAATAATVGWSLSAVQSDSGETSQRRTLTTPIESKEKSNTSDVDYAIAARRLRRPLVDPPPPRPKPPPKKTTPVVQAPPPPPKLDVTLVGTIIQPDQSLAIIADAAGGFDVKGIGESLELSTEGITIQRIESEKVTLLYQGRQSTIELDRSNAKPNKPSGKRGGNIRRRDNR